MRNKLTVFTECFHPNNGAYVITGRTINVSNGVCECVRTGLVGSDVLIPRVAFSATYDIPAGEYNVVFDYAANGITISAPYISVTGTDSNTYQLTAGVNTLPVACKVNDVRNSSQITFDTNTPQYPYTISVSMYPRSGTEYTDNDIFGGVEYNATVNAETDVQYGVVETGEIKFTSDKAIPIDTALLWECKFLDENDYARMGVFTVKSRDGVGNGRYLHRAYEFTDALDRDITRHFKQFLYQHPGTGDAPNPFTIEDLVGDILDYVYKTTGSATARLKGDANENYNQVAYSGLQVAINNGWLPEGTTVFNIASLSAMPTYTARQLLSQCAEICGCFLRTTGVTQNDIYFASFGLPKVNNATTEIYVPYSRRYMGTMSENDSDAAIVEVVTVQDRKNIEEYTDLNLSDGDLVNQYLVQDNIFSAPDWTGDMQAVAENLYNSVISYIGLDDETPYRASEMRAINDLGLLYSEQKTTTYDLALTSTDILVGSHYYRDDKGIYHLTGDISLISSSNFVYGKTYYAIAATSANYSTFSTADWLYVGEYLYELTVPIVYLNQTVYHVNSITKKRLRAGDMYYFDSAINDRIYEAVERSTSVPETPSFLTIGTAHRIDNDGVFHLAGTVTHNASMASEINKSFYAIAVVSGDDIVLPSEDIDSGHYLARVTVGNYGLITSQTIYYPKYTGRKYERRVGMIMSKHIDKTGVSFSSTGGKTREDMQIYN